MLISASSEKRRNESGTKGRVHFINGITAIHSHHQIVRVVGRMTVSDLIERLNSHECEGQFASDCCKDVCKEAADEIERLTAENTKLLAVIKDLFKRLRECGCKEMNSE